jgi:hypothetical protein
MSTRRTVIGALAAAILAASTVTAGSASASVVSSRPTADFLTIGSVNVLVRSHRHRNGQVTVCLDNDGPYRVHVIKNRVKDLNSGRLTRMGGGFLRPWGHYCATSGNRFPAGPTVVSVRAVRHLEGHRVISGDLLMSATG